MYYVVDYDVVITYQVRTQRIGVREGFDRLGTILHRRTSLGYGMRAGCLGHELNILIKGILSVVGIHIFMVFQAYISSIDVI
jgi:hypothetical protein